MGYDFEALPTDDDDAGHASRYEKLIRNQTTRDQKKGKDAHRDPQVSKHKRTPAEQRAEIERVAREHGADLSEEGFNEALRKLGRPHGLSADRPDQKAEDR